MLGPAAHNIEEKGGFEFRDSLDLTLTGTCLASLAGLCGADGRQWRVNVLMACAPQGRCRARLPQYG